MIIHCHVLPDVLENYGLQVGHYFLDNTQLADPEACKVSDLQKKSESFMKGGQCNIREVETKDFMVTDDAINFGLECVLNFSNKFHNSKDQNVFFPVF